MKRRAILIGGFGLTTLAAGAAMLAPAAETDYTSLPPVPREVQEALKASPMSLAEAVKALRAAAPGAMESVELLPEASPPQARALIYNDGAAEWITIDLTSGNVLERSPHSRLPGAHVEGEGTTTDEGLVIFDIREGDGESPPDGPVYVTIHFRAFLNDGKSVDDSYERGAPVTMPIDALLPGMQTGLRSMRPGGLRKLVIPPDLAFGQRGAATVPPNAIVICDMELISWHDYSAVPETLPGDAVTGEPEETDSGLKYYDMVKGDGAQPAGPDTRVRVHYTGWLNDGTKFDSSVDSGNPIDFQLNGVIPGWTEGVGSMRVGGRRKLVIPPDIGYGERGSQTIPRHALLIFDVELIDIIDDGE